MKCARCNRPITRPVNVAGMSLGAKCAAAVAGARPKRRKAAAMAVDPRQVDLFGGAS